MSLLVNSITASRIILSLFLLRMVPLSTEFYAAYILCGLTDIIDGIMARKTHTVSELGGRLDSIADLVMVFVVLKILLPIIDIKVIYFVFIGLITLIRLISLVIVAVKFKTFGIVHTLSNKMTGLMLFIYPLTLPFKISEVMAVMLCLMGVFSAVEELVIHIRSKALDINRRSLVNLKNRY